MIRLEKFTPGDFPQLIEWINNERLLMNWAGSLFSFPLTSRSLEWYIDDTNEKDSSDAFVYKTVDAATGITVGHISLGGISWKNKSARISRVFVKDKGKGYCIAMVKEAIRIGFEELGLHRIGLGVYSDNIAAVKCYEKAGMIQEGTQRDVLLYENEYWSMIEMAIIEEDWKRING
jgi:RimJ/RimL family protein N-acetyltransferase